MGQFKLVFVCTDQKSECILPPKKKHSATAHGMLQSTHVALEVHSSFVAVSLLELYAGPLTFPGITVDRASVGQHRTLWGLIVNQILLTVGFEGLIHPMSLYHRVPISDVEGHIFHPGEATKTSVQGFACRMLYYREMIVMPPPLFRLKWPSGIMWEVHIRQQEFKVEHPSPVIKTNDYSLYGAQEGC